MKKVKILLLLFMMSVLMVACGGETSNESNANVENSDNEYSTENSMAGGTEQTAGTEISLWEKYPIMPGSTWEYIVDDRTTIFANVVYNEDGSATVQGFAYTDNELAEEYLIDKTLYSEDGIYYTTEDGNFDMSVAYSDSVEFVDWENGLFDGTFSLVADEVTDGSDEILEIFTAEDAKDFFRDSSNIGRVVSIEGLYATELNLAYHKIAVSGDIDVSVMVEIGENDIHFFQYDIVAVTGEFVGYHEIYNYPVIKPTVQTTLVELEN